MSGLAIILHVSVLRMEDWTLSMHSYILLVRSSEVFFKIKLNYFMDTLTQQIIFLILKINIFWGDLSGISATTATLVRSHCSSFTINLILKWPMDHAQFVKSLIARYC